MREASTLASHGTPTDVTGGRTCLAGARAGRSWRSRSASANAPSSGPLGTPLDLTHAFDAETVYWPTEEGFVLEPGFAGTTEAGFWYAAHRFRAAERGGTHLDAPIYFARGRRAVEEIPVSQLVGPAVVVDVSDACARDRDHAVNLTELRAFIVPQQ